MLYNNPRSGVYATYINGRITFLGTKFVNDVLRTILGGGRNFIDKDIEEYLERAISGITVQFKGGAVYTYSIRQYGIRTILEMIRLADQGSGLQRFINKRFRRR